MLIGTVVLSPATARAWQPDDAPDPEWDAEAREHLERALSLYREELWDDAREALRIGYAIDPRREFLFVWAQVERLAGNCEGALPLYQRFLDTGPSEAQAGAAREMIELCEEEVGAESQEVTLEGEVASDEPPIHELTAEPEPEPAPEPAPEVQPAEPPEASPTTGESVDRPWHRDPTAAVLLTTGLIAAGGGAALLGLAEGRVRAAHEAGTYGDYMDARDRVAAVPGLRAGGGVLVGAGAALATGAVIRWLVVRRRGAAATTAFAGPSGGHGVSLGIRGRF